jgi:hypothetical protein
MQTSVEEGTVYFFGSGNANCFSQEAKIEVRAWYKYIYTYTYFEMDYIFQLGITTYFAKGCFLLPPYLDEYGETDQGLRRGNPLALSTEKYEVFRKIWLQHGIPEEIARTTEHSTSIVPTEWQFL